ncbi:hypothetical protein ACLBKS_03535 [Hylemonella sp. W303a]|uniref:hypothetical protein n=1 Tax=Hylemonella sp. W303a TaxID=3389873 RepID=UPI00396B1770
MERKIASKRGRPATPLLQRLRVIAWSHHVMVASGAVQADQFERLISKAHPRLRLSSGLWPRYLRGDVMPQGSQERAKSSLIVRLDRVYPGTAEIFYHPLWELMDFDRLLWPKRLREIYLSMNEFVWMDFVEDFGDWITVLLDEEKGPRKVLDATELPFWKIEQSDESLQVAWGLIDGLDGVAVCLIEARSGYLAQDIRAFVNAILGVNSMLKKLVKDPGFQFPKQQSALLILRGMCFRLAELLIIEPGSNEKVKFFERAIRNRRDEWEAQVNPHLSELPRPDRSTMTRWLNQVGRQKFPEW